MNEPLLERVDRLERSVRRWKLVSLALTFVVISLLAVCGTFGLVLVLQGSARDEIEELRVREAVARAEAEQARRAAEMAQQK